MGTNVRINLGRDENIERAIKKFKRQCEKLGIKKEAKARRHYEKPSEIRHKKARALEREKRNARRKKHIGRYTYKSSPVSVVHPKIARLTAKKPDGQK